VVRDASVRTDPGRKKIDVRSSGSEVEESRATVGEHERTRSGITLASRYLISAYYRRRSVDTGTLRERDRV